MLLLFFLIYYYYYYYYHHQKYLALEASLLRQACRPGSTLTQIVKQLHNICCLIGYLFNRVQWCGLNNMKIIPRNISTWLSLAYLTFSEGSWTGAIHSHSPNNFSPPPLLTGIATLLISSVLQSQPIKAGQVPVQYTMQKCNQLVACSRFVSWMQYLKWLVSPPTS